MFACDHQSYSWNEGECGRGNGFHTIGLLAVSNVYATQSSVHRCACPSNRNIWWRNIALLFSTENLNIYRSICVRIQPFQWNWLNAFAWCHYVNDIYEIYVFHLRFLVIHNYVNDSGRLISNHFCECCCHCVPCFHSKWAKRSKRNKLNNAWIIYWIIFIPIQALHYIQSRVSKLVCLHTYTFFILCSAAWSKRFLSMIQNIKWMKKCIHMRTRDWIKYSTVVTHIEGRSIYAMREKKETKLFELIFCWLFFAIFFRLAFVFLHSVIVYIIHNMKRFC